jgi:pyridoxine 5-phosphate synthase
MDIQTKLSVNINKVALIRNSRGSNLPDLVKFAVDCESYGADGITVHPRPDQRHVRYDDIPLLKQVVTTELNIEGYPSPDFIKLVMDNKPAQVTLVPDPPGVLTSNQGWDIKEHLLFLREIIGHFHEEGIRTSLFIEPSGNSVKEAKLVNTDRVELYTGHFAEDFRSDREKSIVNYVETAEQCLQENIGLNAGHDLNLDNLRFFRSKIPNLMEVSIGHALISDALYFGIKNTILMYKNKLISHKI